MKWTRLLLLLFLIPKLIYASSSYYLEEYKKDVGKISAEWKQHEKLVQQFNRLKLEEKEQNIGLIRESIACCNRAIKHCEHILKKIGEKSHNDRKRWKNEKKQAEQDKNNLNTEIGNLQALINALKEIAFSKAVPLYQESEKKANLAVLKNKDCARRLNNVEEVVSALNAVSKLYEEALSLALNALNLISHYPDEESKNVLRKAIVYYETAANKHKKEAADWPASVTTQKNILKTQVATLQEDNKLFIAKGLKRSSYEAQKQMVPLLEQLIESSPIDQVEAFKKELAQLKNTILSFETEVDSRRLTEVAPSLSPQDFKNREVERREFFFKSDFLSNPELFLQNLLQPRPYALPLDGHVAKKDSNFTLYTDQFYRFLVQSNTPASCLLVKMYRQGEVIHEESIAIPTQGSLSWERFLTKDGMVFIPETKLKAEFGLDLRLNFAYDPKCAFSIIIAQKASHSNYQLSISLDGGQPLYTSDFSLPPPWQLDILRKPALLTADRPTQKRTFSGNVFFASENQRQLALLEPVSYPILDQFIEELKKDPLALASYIYHEIALVDPFVHQENGIFYPPSIHRNALRTYLEKKGSIWEQCQLLTYLLRKAGYPTFYVVNGISSLPKTFVEKLLLTKLPEDQKEAQVCYPWVVFFDGKEWISLFPWMKEIQIKEGYDLYNLMPEEYSSADRWIVRYLKGDEAILRHIASDGDDTAGHLFVRFVEDELRKQGLSSADIGLQCLQLKKQFSSWRDFPCPSSHTDANLVTSIDTDSKLFAKALIEFSSHENPQKKISYTLRLADIGCNLLPIQFSIQGPNQQSLHVQFGEQEKPPLLLNEVDRLIDVKVNYEIHLGSQLFTHHQTLSIAKGTSAALCFHFGGVTPKLTSQFYEQFSAEKDEKKRLNALLGFVGAAYFEKCGRSEDTLSKLHKINYTTAMAFGLAKLSPDVSKGPFKGEEDLILPQVDMFWFNFLPSTYAHPTAWHQELRTACHQFQALTLVNQSSNEHQILREVFKDEMAVSTVKLLQLAHQQQQKKGLEGEGFLVFTRSILETIEKTPEAAQSLYFSHLKDLDLRQIREDSNGQWKALNNLLGLENPLSIWAYAYMTPGLTSNPNGSYHEMGTFIFHPYTQYALISNNNLLFHGGLGSALPSYYFTPYSIKEWQLVPTLSSSDVSRYALQVPSPSSGLSFTPPPALSSSQASSPGTKQYSSDVRSEHKSLISYVSDPVDVVTGAFYIDEVDLVLPGPFPLEIRRNYNSQNPLIGDLGIGWKLSLNPYLTKQHGKLYAAETDGTIIAYSYNPETSRWEVFSEDNPDLFNFNQSGIGSTANPFHAYIESDILYSSDGSKRIFEDGLLKKWINNKGSTLTFSYNNKDKLCRIESSNGNFCGFHYNHEGNISEIYAKDGRRISYSYNFQGDLIKVALPNTAVISYDYDHSHRIIRETKPHGKVLENKYVEGRVIEQRSPMGPGQSIISTATFDYQDGFTIVTDAKKEKTTYKIFQKQIYKIIDPLGYETLQSWFINEESWFDPIIEKVTWQKEIGGAVRSLKSSTDKRGLTTYYRYDSRGNPVEIGLKGEDLTGSGESLINKKFAYNDRDLCIQEEVLEQKTLTTYDTTFSYLPKRIETYRGDTLISYVDLEYNSLGQVEKEDQSGSITLWKYDSRGFPRQKIQVTGTEDPDVVTTYTYNNQGQCIEIRSIDSIQENDYDIMGCQIESKTFSPSGTLLSATYIGYDLNNQPIWKQTANPNNTLYLDYHASGLIKASRQTLSPSRSIAYTLYEYDSCGYLIEEVDPLGYTTYRDYDALGRVKSETKEGHSTLFAYEPGGLVQSVTSPTGAKTTRIYTTNGLIKEEIYPDGTKSSMIYDLLGRPFRETKNGITWEITYDDPHHRVTHTNNATKISEIREFDVRGNLIRFTDAAGYTSEKTYDGLGRIKTETSPIGEQTVWSYQGDTVICSLPNGEKQIQRYEEGRVAASEVIDARGNLIASSSYQYDPETDIEKIAQGEEVTTTWMNALGLPIKVQKGNLITTYEYDFCGNCIAIIDGEGRTTHQTFDGLKRITQKELPDGGLIGYAYDLNSNIAEYHLPNGTIWKASYDSMRRKTAEELRAANESSLRWEYTYEKGYLKEAKDPMQRVHIYLYDLNGRLAQETVDGWERRFTYDPRGLLTAAEQIGAPSIPWLSSRFYAPHPEHSKVERSYDADARLILETIYLNSTPIQQTKQTWESSNRALQIGDHTRDFIYQNKQLIQVATREIDLSYVYDLSGSLKHKSTPFSATTIGYNSSGLPENIHTRLPDRAHQETLEWYSSGKLAAYSSPNEQKRFTYTDRGYLQTTEAEKYDFDFGAPGIGVRTAAPGWIVPQSGLDVFGKIVAETNDKDSLTTIYNPMGQVISQGQRQFEWDPWGRLLRVSDENFTWEASYDAFGRRLQTRYTPSGSSTLTATSFYDPEEEFQEIGIKYGDKTFWKIYGPNSCDALTDEIGSTVTLMHNALSQVAGIVSQQSTIYTEKLPSPYGPQVSAVIPSDLLSYAQSLTWHSQAQDPTGLIWMGERYYDPQKGRFLSPDSVGYPGCLDLYAYAGGDPINYMDPNGRFASPVYQTVKPTIIAGLNHLTGYSQTIRAFNRFSAYCYDHNLTRSESFQVGSFDLPNGAIGFVNGIANTKEESMAKARYLSQYAGGAKVYGVYNASNSIIGDLIDSGLGRIGIMTPPTQKIKDEWHSFFSVSGPKAKFFQLCHSHGATHVKNALLTSPTEVRQRIIVLAIAPAEIVPRKLCFQSYNYMSRRDFVTHFDIVGKMRYRDEVIILAPHQDASFFDHDFSSPTFAEPIERRIKNYIKKYGGVQ